MGHGGLFDVDGQGIYDDEGRRIGWRTEKTWYYGGRDWIALENKQKLTFAANRALNILGVLGAKASYTQGHGNWLAGCLSFKEKGHCFAEVKTNSRGVKIQAIPVSPVFDSLEELLDHVKSQSDFTLIDAGNTLTPLGEKVWGAFESEESDSPVLQIISKVTNLNFDDWWNWTHQTND